MDRAHSTVPGARTGPATVLVTLTYYMLSKGKGSAIVSTNTGAAGDLVSRQPAYK